jgi:cytoskeletal protein CcmA (bactofilin family)
MLRMGRSPKTEPEESRPQTSAGQPQQFNPQTPGPPVPAPPAARAPQAAPPETYEKPSPPARETSPGVSRAVTESEALARDLKEGVVSGFVGTGTTVSGDAEFKGMLRVDGHFKGRIRSEKGALIVSAGGLVDADVEVATARVNGTVNGDIVASERIEFGRSARVHGNIQTPTLVIEQGAIFEGQCRMQTRGADAAQPRPAAARPPAVQSPQPKPPAAQPKPPTAAQTP